MLLEDLIGKTVTNIYVSFGSYQGWLETAVCFVELDNTLMISIPKGFSEEVRITNLDPKADSIFKNLENYPVYHVNKDGKSISEIAEKYKKKKRNVFDILKTIFGKPTIIKEYQPYKVEFQKNNAKHLQNKKIVDFLWYDDTPDMGFLLLENGYVITETYMSPHGTGHAGLNYYESLSALTASKGNEYKRLTEIRGLGPRK